MTQDVKHVGRKEIICLFKSVGMLSMHISFETSWRIMLRWRNRYAGMEDLFHHLPNGKPYVLQHEVLVWLKMGLQKRV